jgi:hypothetical protein
LGFDAGDSNLYRYVNNRPTAGTDPSGFQFGMGVGWLGKTGTMTVSHFKKLAAARIDPTPLLGVRKDSIATAMKRNIRITAAYAELYSKNPTRFLYLAAATAASREVGILMSNLFNQSQHLRSNGKALAADRLDALIYRFGEGNKAIYEDFYWQFLAYQAGGIGLINSFAGSLEKIHLDAWRLIDKGDAASVMKGTLLFVKREQEDILQPALFYYLRKTLGVLSLFGPARAYVLAQINSMGKSSLFKGTTFNAVAPINADITNIRERMQWIEKFALPEFAGWLEKNGTTFSKVLENVLDEEKRGMRQN